MSRFTIESQPSQGGGGRFTIEEQPDPNAFLNEPATDPLGRLLGQTVGQSQGRGNQIANGLTFGMGAEIAGAANDIKRAIGLSDRDTADVMKDWDRIRTGYAEENPVSAAGLEMVGAAPTLLIPGLGGARVAQGARAGLRPAITEGAKLGLKYGVVSIPGRADISPDDTGEEALGKLATSAVREPLTNTVGGALGAGIGQTLGKGYDVVRRTVANNLTGRRSAETAFNATLDQSGTSAGAMLDELLPKHKTLPPDKVERAFTVMGESMKRANGNSRVASADAVNRLASEWNAKPATVRNQLKALQDRYSGKDSPLFLSEQSGSQAALKAAKAKPNATDADMMRYEDDQARQTLDYLANQPGKARSEVRAQIGQRVAQQGEKIKNILTDAVGGQDFETLSQQLDQALANQGRAGYKAAFQQEATLTAANQGQSPLKPRLERVMNRIYSRLGQRGGVVAESLRKALAEFEDVAMIQNPGQAVVNPRITSVVGSLQKAMDARGVLKDMADKASEAGERQVAASLRRFYNEVTVAMRRTYPEWWRANQVWGDIRTGEEAMQFVLDMPLQAGPRQRQTLKMFDRLAPHQKDRARVAYVTKLHQQINSPTDGSDVLRWAKSENGRQVLRRIMGDKQADGLLKRLREFAMAKSTNTMVGGSQTASRQATREAMDAPLDMVAQADNISFGGIRRAVTNAAVQRLKDRRNVPLGRIATSPMDRPEQVIPQLRRLQQAQARSQPNLQGRGDLARRIAQALVVANQGMPRR